MTNTYKCFGFYGKRFIHKKFLRLKRKQMLLENIMQIDEIEITYLEKMGSLLLQDYQLLEAEQRTERNLQNITKKNDGFFLL